jgi:NAD-dependent SIR2 family protein deacetylase
MSAPTKLLPAHLVSDLHGTLARLRCAREIDPRHEERVFRRDGQRRLHIDCEVCTSQARLDMLLDKLPW